MPMIEDLEAIEARNRKAQDALTEVCQRKGGKLTMTVPARLEEDDDLVIMDALADAEKMIQVFRELEAKSE